MIAVRLVSGDADLERWVAVRNAVELDAPSTLDDLRTNLRRQPETRFWLAEEDGEAVACSFVARSAVPGRAFVLPRVVPAARRRGAGSALHEAGLGYARTLGCGHSRTSVNGADAASLAFASGRGYEEVDRQVELVRPLGAGQPEPEGAPEGIELAPGADPEELRPLVVAGVADMPVVGGLDEGVVDELLDEYAQALYVVGARADGQLVGVAGLAPYGAREGALEHTFTTVLPSHRRRGIALALKRACVRWAAGAGYRELVTWTQGGNDGMRAVNERAGFAPGAVSLTLEARL